MNLAIARRLIAAGLRGMTPGEVRALDEWLMAHGYEPTWSDRAGQPSRREAVGR